MICFLFTIKLMQNLIFTGDQIGLFTTLLLITLITIYELRTLYSIYKLESEASNVNQPSFNLVVTFVIGIYILLNVLINMFLTIYTDTSTFKLANQLPIVLMPDWRYCSVCELNSPPRSFHCHTCNRCILKRSNHCTFLGKCCGYLNARYYYLFLVYTCLAALYCNILNIEYFYDLMHNGFSIKLIFVSLMPIFAWLFGIVDNFRLYTIFVNTTCFIAFLMLLFYIIINVKLIKKGQTWYENANNIHVYIHQHEKNLKFNFLIDIFGYNWYLTLFFPFIKHELPGDGTHFKKVITQVSCEDVKSI